MSENNKEVMPLVECKHKAKRYEIGFDFENGFDNGTELQRLADAKYEADWLERWKDLRDQGYEVWPMLTEHIAKLDEIAEGERA